MQSRLIVYFCGQGPVQNVVVKVVPGVHSISDGAVLAGGDQDQVPGALSGGACAEMVAVMGKQMGPG